MRSEKKNNFGTSKHQGPEKEGTENQKGYSPLVAIVCKTGEIRRGVSLKT